MGIITTIIQLELHLKFQRPLTLSYQNPRCHESLDSKSEQMELGHHLRTTKQLALIETAKHKVKYMLHQKYHLQYFDDGEINLPTGN